MSLKVGCLLGSSRPTHDRSWKGTLSDDEDENRSIDVPKVKSRPNFYFTGIILARVSVHKHSVLLLIWYQSTGRITSNVNAIV